MPHLSAVMTPMANSAEVGEIVAATQRWLERAVIGLNLCPFAKAVHVKKQIRYAETDQEVLDTTLLIHPQVMGNFLDFHFFLAEANAAIRKLGFEGVFQIASLHPQYEFAGSDADDIDNFSNRSPYPTLHLLREASIDRAVAAFPDAADIFERNIETLQGLGHEGWRQLWLDQPPKS